MKKRFPALLLFFFLFIFIGPFLYGGMSRTSEEKNLLESLKKSRTDHERQIALTRLYEFYKQKQIDYLELSYLQKLIEVRKINKNFAGLETSYYDLAEIYKKKRDYHAALDYYFEALVYSRKIEKNRSGYIYLNISEIFSILNRKELAKKYINMALDYSNKYKDKDLIVFLFSANSKLYYEDEDYPNALRFINLSIKTEKQRNKYLCAISSLYQKALILLKLAEQDDSGDDKNAKIAEAVQLLKNAVEIGLKEKKYEGLLPIMCEYIEKLLEDHLFLEAADYLDQIDDIYAPYYPYYFFFYYLKAIFFEKQGLIHSARRYYRKTAEALEKYFAGLHGQQYHSFREKTEDIYSRIIEFYLKLYNRRWDSFYLKKAMYFSEVKNSYIYELVLQNNKTYTHFMEEKKKLEQEFLLHNKKYLQLLKNSLDETDKKRLKVREYENKLEKLQRQNEELMEFILEYPMTYKAYYSRDFNIPKIREKLTPRQLIVKYTVLKDHIHAFCIDNRSLRYRELTGTTREITGMVKQLTEPLDDFTRDRVDYLRINYNLSLARELYDILLKDILESREPGLEIFIIPDGELFKLPFEALVTGFNQDPIAADVIFSEYASANYLVEKHPVSYALSLFHFLKKTTPSRGKKYKYIITGFGCPIVKKKNPGGSSGGSDTVLFGAIPSSERELLSIPAIFGEKQSRVFLKDDFNRMSFETYAPRSRLLHIATHFINNIHYPRYSALLFSPGRQNVPFYYAHEIFRLKLDIELVVLSACESSEKHLLGFQGLRGMTAAFRHSGVQSMIVSMWPVDEHSSQLTPLFYSEYKHRTRPQQISPTLREAKLKLVKQTAVLENGLKISFSHPFIWANYILYHFNY
ncbi:MAG: CHAT domain-containing protein [Candidatus Aminicenantes bacterium]|nr:CHAT domain-containing protein [Candidatus Aminicenantes bacterium]NIN20851.1 CHAT domain-containing protein [Candidatus Aminicenantes bacterium]NIN44672.1 CHAT domain-containing protein [Candidatus Aminicenantes bacterium]NIN86828.1 CHAT domain-containing protein [Candidatus Aminicenantes bacterium]NIO83770.1 CHAT domain-containing protein [Candidatus Aminicenantes bacterium]